MREAGEEGRVVRSTAFAQAALSARLRLMYDLVIATYGARSKRAVSDFIVVAVLKLFSLNSDAQSPAAKKRHVINNQSIPRIPNEIWPRALSF